MMNLGSIGRHGKDKLQLFLSKYIIAHEFYASNPSSSSADGIFISCSALGRRKQIITAKMGNADERCFYRK